MGLVTWEGPHESVSKSEHDLCFDLSCKTYSTQPTRGEEGIMKDVAESMELGVSQQRGASGSRSRAWLQNECVRVGLAETLCTYIMMVRQH